MFIPGHITGFFKIYKDKELLKTGSTGAGITLNKGVYTNIVEGDGEVYFNGDKIELCPTIEVIKNYLNYLNYNESDKFNYNIIHKSDFPLGCGVGTSGSCALGTSHELSKIYNMEPDKVLEFAHTAEVKCGTGLGDVVAQYTRGFVIRKKPGLPINVEKINIKNINDYNVVVEILGKKETGTIINNIEWIDKINKTSDELLQKLLKNPTLENFMSLSYTFAKDTGLATDEITSLCDDLSFTIGSSQAMLGNTVFCICEDKDLNDVLSILNNPIVCKIYQ
ncbi:pantoate kinase [Methanothermococcus sp.]|uniref:pantoate kinase n=1 Tax=Methanothermococcus sp. TaxID=2614238 RepID=UPI0025E64648|nr:pantoate kinase [Methanothermococcus sp.]